MTHGSGSPFGTSPPGSHGPFGSGPAPGPGQGFPGGGPQGPGAFQHPAPFLAQPQSHSFPQQSNPPRQNSGITAAWIVGVLVAVVALGGGGAAAVHALGGGFGSDPGDSGVVSPGPDQQQDEGSAQSGADSLIIGGGSSDEAGELAPSEEEDLEGNAERSEIYRNSTDFRFLEDQAGVLMPGVSFYAESGAQCSAGWFVAEEGGDSVYMATAGHCLEEGEEVFYVDQSGELLPAGVAVLSTGGDLESDLDYGLVELYPGIDWDPVVPVPEGMQVVGSANANWVEENQPYICRLGFRSGLSCGDYIERTTENIFRYENISDQGDSGGPVWAQDPGSGDWYAVGITSFMEYTDATNAGAVALSPLLKANEFKIIVG